MKRFVLFILLAFSFIVMLSSCGQKNTQEIRIATNPWVGYTPIAYAQEKGWLKETGFKFIWVSGLEENAKLYEKGLVDGFAATQYEYMRFPDRRIIKPFFLIDKSFGADVILSNRSIEQLKSAKKGEVKAKFELSSVNRELFEAFLSKYSLDKDSFVLSHAEQNTIARMKSDDGAMVIVSYEPYVSQLVKNGFKRIASTRELDNIHIIDAIFINTEVVKGRQKDVAMLKAVFDKAVVQLQKDPKEFYDTVKNYLENQSYEEFLASTKDILWLNISAPPEVIEHLHKQNVPTDRLIK